MYLPPEGELASCCGFLYKYRPARDDKEFNQIISMIERGSLWFWHLTGQNDPNECKPLVYFGGDKRSRFLYFKDDFARSFPNLGLRNIEKMAMRAARNPVIPKPSSIYKHWTVCCFSSDANSEEMWGKYASNGGGVVITYLADSSVSLGRAGRVKYSDDKVLLDILNMNNDKMYEIFTTKECKWSYEKEYRLVMRLERPGCGVNVICKDVKIVEVVIGDKMLSDKAMVIERLCFERSIKVSVRNLIKK